MRASLSKVKYPLARVDLYPKPLMTLKNEAWVSVWEGRGSAFSQTLRTNSVVALPIDT